MRYLAILLCAVLASCTTSTEDVSKALLGVQKETKAAKENFETIKTETEKEQPSIPLIKTEAEQGIKHTNAIDTQVTKGLKEIPNIEDKGLSWSEIWNRFFWLIILTATVLFVILTPIGRGIAGVIGLGFSWVLSILPTPQKKLGTMLAKAEDPKDDFDNKQLVAAVREISPAVKMAYTKAKKSKKGV